MCLVGVVSRRWVWLVGGIYGYGYNVKVWLVGIVVRRFIDILTIIGASLSEPHTYRTIVQNPPYIYIYI